MHARNLHQRIKGEFSLNSMKFFSLSRVQCTAHRRSFIHSCYKKNIILQRVKRHLFALYFFNSFDARSLALCHLRSTSIEFSPFTSTVSNWNVEWMKKILLNGMNCLTAKADYLIARLVTKNTVIVRRNWEINK